jgi:hypothetical protein
MLVFAILSLANNSHLLKIKASDEIVSVKLIGFLSG